MKPFTQFLIFGFSICLGSLLFIGKAAAGCPDGDPNSNLLICNDDSNQVVEGNGGGDAIFVSSNANVYNIIGDGNGTGSQQYVGNGGNDVISNTGTVEFDIFGDFATGDGGDDTIINNGTVVGTIVGDFVPGNGGDDTIINNGNAAGAGGGMNGVIQGDVAGGQGGNDTITNNGSAIAITGGGGNDTITNNGTVINYIKGDDGNDTVIINFGSNVGAIIDGGNGTDTLTFSDVTAAIQTAIQTACPNFSSFCTFTVEGHTYDAQNFENVTFLARTIAIYLIDIGILNDIIVPQTVQPKEICSGAVKSFRLVNGDIEVYSGFSDATPNGFRVGVIPQGEQQAGRTFTNLVQGWSMSLISDGSIQVFDGAGNLVGTNCFWQS